MKPCSHKFEGHGFKIMRQQVSLVNKELLCWLTVHIFFPLDQSQTFMLCDHYLLNQKVFRTSKLLGTIHNMQPWDLIPCFLMLYTNLLPQNNNFFLNYWLPIHIPLWGEVLVTTRSSKLIYIIPLSAWKNVHDTMKTNSCLFLTLPSVIYSCGQVNHQVISLSIVPMGKKEIIGS